MVVSVPHVVISQQIQSGQSLSAAGMSHTFATLATCRGHCPNRQCRKRHLQPTTNAVLSAITQSAHGSTAAATLRVHHYHTSDLRCVQHIRPIRMHHCSVTMYYFRHSIIKACHSTHPSPANTRCASTPSLSRVARPITNHATQTNLPIPGNTAQQQQQNRAGWMLPF